ncbi:glycoside hydrolase family 18 protein [Ephemerocybe angulata]|uniref:Glycoside hydrolase family 18 protein n=1 Tax=Ephemerocybe angulata TaxID=980116 RepID=A0A8H6M317_9AGAR|nr:glycoside hydrolase family 18 protein [Tulosesus angulatus]
MNYNVKLELASLSTRGGGGGHRSGVVLKEASVVGHTTSSVPRPHVLYVVRLVYTDGSTAIVAKRFSEFLTLHAALRDEGATSCNSASKAQNAVDDSAALPFPPRRALLLSLVPNAWLDDSVLDERKAGLNEFLCVLLNTEKTRAHPSLASFFRAPSYTELALESLGEGLAQLSLARRVKSLQVECAERGEDDSRPPRGGLIAASYYPSWVSWSLPVESVDWSRFDIVFYAFVIPNQRGGLDWPDNGERTIQKLVNAGARKRAGTKVVLSVGGWGGSRWFSEVVGNPVGRASFINNLAWAVESLGLDGVDIDWEYPNSSGAGNPHSPGDSDNLLQFMKALRSRLGNDKIISAAVSHLPWLGANGKPLTNVSEFAKCMTYVNIMNYDVWPASPNPGPNAPLGDLCNTSAQPQANAKAAFAQWTKAGMPASKLLMGLATYGYVSKSSKTKLSGSSMPPALAPGSHPRVQGALCRPTATDDTAPAGDLSSMWGQQIAFNQLVRMGALVKKGDGTYGGANGYTMDWDDCSDTPFVWNKQRQTVVSYDDTYSIGSKAKYVRDVGMAGCFTWSLDQDDGLTLHEAARAGLGK